MNINRFLLIFVIVLACHKSEGQDPADSCLKNGLQLLEGNLNIINDVAISMSSRKDSFVNRVQKVPLAYLNTTQTVIAKFDGKSDSILKAVTDIPKKYIKEIDKKIDKYSHRITKKTEKTLSKLSRWEVKIKNILDKASPETSARLFGKNKNTFSSMLEKIKKGESILSDSRNKYDTYRDKLTNNLKYIESQKDKLDSNIITPVTSASIKMKDLNREISQTEAIEKIIKERKKELINGTIKYLGKSKYFGKINKESYYYAETLRNYKEIFSDSKKAEETAKNILNKIPSFKKFVSENSLLASLFGNSGNGTSVNLDGLQTREEINNLIQEKISTGGPDTKQIIGQGLARSKLEIEEIKAHVTKAGRSSNGDEIPQFKPNQQKSKTFLQRLEYSANVQLEKVNKYLPAAADIGMNAGYKLNDRSILGIGASYKLGIGSIEKITFSNQGISIKSFVDWKLKMKFFITGAYEMNYVKHLKSDRQTMNFTWQQAGLIGLTKKIEVKSKMFKGTKFQILYNFLQYQDPLNSQRVMFRFNKTF